MSTHALKFTPSIHTRPTPSIDPSKVRLSPGFTVLVLGASRGIGASIATSYAVARASTVILAARSASSVEGTAQECKNLCPGIRIEKEACDVSSAESVEALAVRLKEKVGSLDVLVMNSGVFGSMIRRMTEGKAEDFKMAMDINALGTYYAAHYLVPLLLAKGDRGKAFVVVNTAGTWVTEGIIAHPGYYVSKFAQMRIVEMLGKQFEDEGLLAVAVHPGAVETELTVDASKEFRKYLTDSVDLCSAFIVWLTKDIKDKAWLNSRWLAVTWDVDQLEERKEEIVAKDLLRAKLRL